MKLLVLIVAFACLACVSAQTNLTLSALVSPSTVIVRDGKTVTFALHGVVEFQTLQQLFAYVDAQVGRWTFPSPDARDEFGVNLMRKGVESRVISMVSEEPWEVMLTHTIAQLDAAIARLPDPVFRGAHWSLNTTAYRIAFHRVRERWYNGLNCWSQSPVIAARVLSNFYLIPEGFPFDGVLWDSLEHPWQAIKYHPSVTVQQLVQLLGKLAAADWRSFFARIDSDQKLYTSNNNAFIVEFVRANLASSKLAWFREQLSMQPAQMSARVLQQHTPGSLRYTSVQEKTLWGDLADLCYLLVWFARDQSVSLPDPSLLNDLLTLRFDAVYLLSPPRQVGFISQEFRSLMLELFKRKFLSFSDPNLARFGDVIRSIPRVVHLDHYLNDGDAADIPLTLYREYLNQVRDLAWQQLDEN